ncbi:LysR family transcriptional regulator [Salinicoccus sp. ID82-1]|uniref:LysR family transcriptional regulator n=1 Tax=Salinicoccus cyprini TaxID=2493691 RepID=A0A558AV75_9STAP|nr:MULTISPECIES: LysR family transcriptional regulator [Salinicoccus]MCG1010465.1 LysR family transcriptional regulator [Salinicoccus sp. ID82-1]TVT28161.1 LysR family transcriptional regulator [Salinicoccus cyprini]
MINQIMKVFVAVVEEESFTKAAQRLHMTQPAVSGYIRQLEEELDITLIERSTRGVRLNAAGDIYYHHAKEMMTLESRMQHLILDLQEETKGPVKIGASYTYGEYILPTMLAALVEKHPKIVPEVHISNSATIMNDIRSATLDIGIIEDEIQGAKVNMTRLLKDEMHVIGEAGFPDHPTHRSLREATWLIREEGSGTRSYQEQAFSHLDIQPKTITLSSTQAIKNAVASGMGLSLLSKHTINHELETGRLKRIEYNNVALDRHFYLLTPDVRYHSTSTLALLDMFNSMAIEHHEVFR